MSKQKMTQYFIIAMTTLLLAVSGRLAAAEVSAAPEASSTPGIPEELIRLSVGIEDVEEFFLRLLPSAQKLDVIDREHVDLSVEH